MGTIKPAVNPALIIGLCFLVAALEGYDIQAFGVAAPKMVAVFHLSPALQGWIASAATIGLVTGALFGGWLADGVGRRPVLLAAVAGFGAGTVWTAFAGDLPILIVARVVTGLGMGAAMPNLVAIATEISSPRRRGATTSAMFCGMPTGGAAVALLATVAAGSLGWRGLFLVGGVTPLLLAPLLFFLLPETRADPERTEGPALWPALFGGGRAAPTLLLWTASLATLVVLYLMLNWLPTLVIAKGHTAHDGAAASLAFNLTAVVGTVALGFVVDRFGFRWSLLAAYGILAAVMTALSAAAGLDLILPLSAAAGFLVVGGLFSLYGLPSLLYPPRVLAAGAGAAVGIGRLGSIIGPLVAGQLRQAGWSADQVLLAMLPVVVAAGAAIFTLTFFARAYEAPP